MREYRETTMTPIEDESKLTVDQKDEATERQLAEVEFIRSAYSSEEAYVSENGDHRRRTIVRRLRLPAACASSDGAGGATNHCEVDAATVDLSLEMPEAYPVREDATLIVSGSLVASPSNPPYVRKAALYAVPRLAEACRRAASEASESQGVGEAVWSVLSCAEEWINCEWETILEEHGRNASVNAKSSGSHSTETIGGAEELGRRIIYSHHIIASSKRRDIADLVSHYKLGGYMKIGWPGVILIEGSEPHCQIFVDEIRRWRWQQLQVRGEERKVIPDGRSLDLHRRLSMRFEEIGEDGMSLLANNCREAGLEALFLTCMKINDRRTMEDQERGDVESSRTGSNHGVLVRVDHMNDGKRYRKWLHKTCQAQGCNLLIRQCHLNVKIDNDRPAIYVGIFGDKDSVKQVMKLWRTSRVDVDSRKKLCLERMMAVVEEGEIQRIPGDSLLLDDENDLNCSFEDFASLIGNIDTGWSQNLRNEVALSEE